MAIRCSVGSAWHVAISRTLSFLEDDCTACDVLAFVGKTVQKAYPLGLLGSFNQEKAKKIHQLRMYIDRQNITYIRDF